MKLRGKEIDSEIDSADRDCSADLDGLKEKLNLCLVELLASNAAVRASFGLTNHCFQLLRSYMKNDAETASLANFIRAESLPSNSARDSCIVFIADDT